MSDAAPPLSRRELAEQLLRIGLRAGDTVYARARFSSIGPIEAPARENLVGAFLDAIGGQGTLIVPAFTDPNYRWEKEKAVFSLAARSYTGVLARAVIEWPGTYRSFHPTHSFAAIGRDARALLEDHTPDKTAFFPIRRLVERDAKTLAIGCSAESPGVSTAHLVQQELGLSRQHWTRFLVEIRYESEGKEVVWHPTEDPGCSLGFDKMYRHYIRTENFEIGRLGNAQTILVGARRAYEVDRQVLADDPKAVLCDRPDCLSCRILRGYNLSAMPAAAVRFVLNRLRERRVS